MVLLAARKIFHTCLFQMKQKDTSFGNFTEDLCVKWRLSVQHELMRYVQGRFCIIVDYQSNASSSVRDSVYRLRILFMIFQIAPFVLHLFWGLRIDWSLRITFSPFVQTDVAIVWNNRDTIVVSEILDVPVLWSANVHIITGRVQMSFAIREQVRQRR